MKRSIKLLTVLLASLLFLTACSSSAVTQVENSDEVFAEINDVTITKGDVYNFIKLKYGVNLISAKLVDMEIDKLVTLDEADTKKAEETLEKTKETLKDQFELLVKSQGFKDEEDYFRNYVLKSIKIDKLFNMYVAENLENITKDLYTKKVKLVRTSSKAEAEEALKSLQDLEEITDENFKEIAEKYAADDKKEAAGKVVVENYVSGRETDSFLNNHLKENKKGLVEEVIMNNAEFVVLYLEDINLETDLEAVITSIVDNEDIAKVITNEMYLHYAKLGNFEIHDSRVNELFNENNPFQNKGN